MTQNVPPQIAARFGTGSYVDFSIGDGWVPTVIELDAALAELDPNYGINQIKEKFGGLRFYFFCDDPNVSEETFRQMYELSHAAEQKCSGLCEECGASSQVRLEGSWYVNLCDTHLEERRMWRKAQFQ